MQGCNANVSVSMTGGLRESFSVGMDVKQGCEVFITYLYGWLYERRKC